MKELPFNAKQHEVQAILAGRQSQFRRIVKPQPHDWSPMQPQSYCPIMVDRHGEEHPGPEAYGAGNDDGSDWITCPHGAPGDRLWVRETFQRFSDDGETLYKADNASIDAMKRLKHDGCLEARWRSPIHMLRWASRITLEVTEVRVERLQGISEADAIAEGCLAEKFPGPWWQGYRELNDFLIHQKVVGEKPPEWMIEPKRMPETTHLDRSAVDKYRELWESIYGAGSWDLNSWVWAISFRVLP